MNLPRIIKRYLSAWQGHRLDKRIKLNSYRLRKMCPELERARVKRHMAEIRHGRVKPVDTRRVRVMNELLRG